MQREHFFIGVQFPCLEQTGESTVDPAAARKTVKQRFRTERATAKHPSRTGLYEPASTFQRLPEVTDIQPALGAVM